MRVEGPDKDEPVRSLNPQPSTINLPSDPSTINPPASRVPEPITNPGTDPWLENHANWFAAALLMPPLPLRRAAGAVDVTVWRGRYELSERCGVSVSALNVRLRQLGYPPIK